MTKASTALAMRSIAVVRSGPKAIELRDHRIIVDRNLPALSHAAVDADARAVRRTRFPVPDQPPGGRQKSARRIFRINACLNGRAGEHDVVLFEFELLASGNTDHQLDEIEPGH